MDNFTNLTARVRDFIPKELPRMPPWAHTSMNPDDQFTEDHDEGQEASQHTQNKSSLLRSASMVLAEPKPIENGPKSFLDLINECDNFPYFHADTKLYLAHINTYYAFHVKDYPDTPLGYILPSVAQVFQNLPDWEINDTDRTLTLTAGTNEGERTKIVAQTTQAMRATDHFKVLRGWRDELYPVYGPGGKLLLSMERAASALFGIVTYGVHMTAYTYKTGTEGKEKELMIWVPRRAKTKSTYGGMMDNTVAGGISTSENALESLIRESKEEASLDEAIVRKNAKAVGTVTYFHIRDHRAGGETRLLQPECQYVYDLELNNDVVPKPGDDEVESFELMDVDAVKEVLRDGQFKPNCALVLIDFFVRHGILTCADSGYIEIIARLHRILEFPTP